MKVIISRKSIFKNVSDVEYNISTDPKIVSFRRYWDGESKSFLSVYDIEIYCIVDQRSILEEDISKIEVYLASNELSHYDSPQPSAYSLGNIDSPNDINNITFDLINIQESEGIKKFDDHVYLTSLEPHQNFNKFPARKSNVALLTDSQAFGVTPKYIVSEKRPSKTSERRSQAKTGDKYLDFFRNSDLFKPKSEEENIENTALSSRTSFSTNYRKLIMLGIDPMSIFQRPDRGQGLSEFLKGAKTIDKCINHNHNLRKIVKKLSSNFDTTGMNTPVGVRKVNVPNRIVRLKTKMTLTLRELLALKATGENLIFYALDSENNKVDSENYQFSIDSMLNDLRSKRPAYKFDASSSRNRSGFIATSIQNHEKEA